jgi:hypothetical protein
MAVPWQLVVDLPVTLRALLEVPSLYRELMDLALALVAPEAQLP